MPFSKSFNVTLLKGKILHLMFRPFTVFQSRSSLILEISSFSLFTLKAKQSQTLTFFLVFLAQNI